MDYTKLITEIITALNFILIGLNTLHLTKAGKVASDIKQVLIDVQNDSASPQVKALRRLSE